MKGTAVRARVRFRALDGPSKAVLVVGAALALTIAGWAFLAPGVRDKPSPPPPLGYGYWHTGGVSVLDSLNRPVRIAAVTWFGAESTTWVPAGLDFQPYRKIIDTVKALGYNTIRLPFSNELVERNPVVTGWVRANPGLRGRHALTVMDDIVAYAGRMGLKIILDDQRSAAAPARPGSASGVSTLNEPLWYTSAYPQSRWIADWEMLARRYLGNTTVVGFDLRNEPHTNQPGLPQGQGYGWGLKAYLQQGATWGPYRGLDDPKTDWRLAAEKAGNAVLKINNSLLIIVEGLQLYPAAGQPHGVNSYWWGGILQQVRRYPVVLTEKHQLVYSPHEYGPNKFPYYSWFQHLTYAGLVAKFDSQWAFLLRYRRAPFAAPIFIGETGTCTDHPWCLRAGLPSSVRSDKRICRPGTRMAAPPCRRVAQEQGLWLRFLVRFLRIHNRVGWSLWALNGTNALDSAATDGLLRPDWSGVQSAYLQRLLSTIQR